MQLSFARSLRLLALASCGLAVILALNLVPVARGGWGWRWPYQVAAAPQFVMLTLAAGLYTAAAWALLRRSAPTRLLLAWSVAGTVILSLVGIALRHDDIGFELFTRTMSGVTTGPHKAAAEIDWSANTLREWPAIIERSAGSNRHITTTGPGLPLVVRASISMIDAVPGLAETLQRPVLPYQCHNTTLLTYSPAAWGSAWVGMLMPLWAGLSVFLAYGAARALSGREAARYAALWWPLVPALVMFVPSWFTLFPAGALVVLWALAAGLARDGARRAALLIAAGGALGALLVANFVFVPIALIAGLMTLGRFLLVERPRSPALPWWRPVIAGAWFGMGIALPWLVLWVGTGLSPVELVDVVQKMHLELDRPYAPWVVLHLWDWAVMTGLPLLALWLAAVWHYARTRQGNPPLLGLALLLTVIALALSGTSQGESGRVWLPFSGMALVAAGAALSRWNAGQPGPDQARTWGLVTVGQGALLLALMSTWNVMGSEMVPPPHPTPAITDHPAEVRAGRDLRLVGWGAAVEPGTGDRGPVIVLRLNWQADRRVLVPYFLAALPVSPSGAPVGEAVVVQPDIPMTCWGEGEVAGAEIRLPLPADAEPGEWWISLAVLGDARHTYEPLTLSFADGSRDTQVGIGPVTVP